MPGWWPNLVMLLHLGVAALALALALWLATSTRLSGAAVRACAAALAVSAGWSLAMSATGAGFLLTELLFIASQLAWLWALYRLFGHEAERSVAPIRAVVAALALVEAMQGAIMLAAIGYSGKPGVEDLLLRLSVSFRLLFCVGALVLVHNLYAGAAPAARQALRWPAAALGVIWLYDLNLHTITYLIDAVPTFLAGLRPLALLGASLLLLLGCLRDEADMRFQPSRSFAFQSFSLLIIGAYLVVMVLIAQGLAYAGREYGAVLQTGFLLLAALLALALLPSRKLRAWLRVMVSKHLFQHRYDYRAEWLRFTGTIGRAGPQAPPLKERIVQAVADITDSPAGLLLTPREEGGLALAARWQWPAIEVPGEALDAAAATFFEQSQFIVDLDELRRGGASPAGLPSLGAAWLTADEQAWAMVPLLHYERLHGVVVLARAPVARALDWEDFDLLRVVGRQLASYLAEQASQDALGEAQRFEEFNRRIAFVMHDIKNLASQLSLLSTNAEKHADKPAFRADMILTLRKSTDKLQALLARLSRYGGAAGGTREEVDLGALVDRVAAQYRGKHEVAVTRRDRVTAAAQPEALEQAIVHLVQNGIDASKPHVPVLIELRGEGADAVIEIVDAGCGMSPEFVRSRLFRPFQSTKSGGFGIGAFEARELVRAMGGRLDVESREGLGTRFAIRLPARGAQESPRADADRKIEVA